MQASHPELPVRPLVCDWDGSSVKPGPSRNGLIWRDLLPRVTGLLPPIVLNRRLGELLPAAVSACVSGLIDAGERPLLLGGDHRLTYSALHAVVHRHGPLDVHHFDAHHDAHPSVTLNNFSVFRYAAERLGVGVIRHGVREPNEPAAPEPLGTAATYITIDVDFLDPAIVSSVSFPVPPPTGLDCGPDLLRAKIEQLGAAHTVVAADLVEWCADRSTDDERDLIVDILQAMTTVLGGRP